MEAANSIEPYILSHILKGGNTAGSIVFKSAEEGCEMMVQGHRETTEAYERQQQTEYHFAPLPTLGQYEFAEEPITGLFDVATFCANTGNDYWLNEIDAPRMNKSLKIKVGMAAPWFITQKQYFDRLIKLVSYIDHMEAGGTRCEVWAVQHYTNGKLSLEIKLKEQGDHLNIGQLVYQLATTVLLRFAWFLISAKHHGERFGKCVGDTKMEELEAENAKANGDLYIPSFYVQSYTYGDTIQECYPEYFRHLQNSQS